MDMEVSSLPSHSDVRRAPTSLGTLTFLAYYNSYPSSRIHHYCNGQWYLLVLDQLQKLGFVDGSEAWFVSDRPAEFEQHGVRVRCFESFAAMAAAARPTDVLWVRGKCKAYVEVLRRLPAKLRVYYPASKRFVSRDWTHFDVILVDDARQVAPVTRLAGASVHRVIKTADPAIFRPLAGTEKSFDLCMIGGMQLTRKNYPALVRVLENDPSLSAVVVGKSVPAMVDRLRSTGAAIRFIDFCSREELNVVMNQSRIGFVPSLMDAAPRVILEFMAAGTPVLLNSAILGGRDYITDETGVLADESEFVRAANVLRNGLLPLNPRRGFERQFQPVHAARHLGEVLTQAMEWTGRSRPSAPPSWVVRLLTQPVLLRRRLARCWREIEATAT